MDAENQRFVYDAENRQTAFFRGTNNTQTADATYQYDGEGKRVRKIANNVETVFVYNASRQLIAEYSNQMPVRAKVSYLTTDHLGSPRVITDEGGVVVSRHDYLAFGDEVTDTLGNAANRTTTQGYGNEDEIRKQYTGYERDDESGLEYAQARYYNSKHGRFTSVDPLTASANVKDPQTFNRYSYVLNSPYKFVDPLGLISQTTGANGGGAWCSTCKTSDDGSIGFLETEQHVTDPAPPPTPDENTETSTQNQRKDKVNVNVKMRGYDVTGTSVNEAISNARGEAARGATPSGNVAETVPKSVNEPNINQSLRITTTQDASTGLWTSNIEITDNVIVDMNVEIIMPSWSSGYSEENPDFSQWRQRTYNLANHEYEHVGDIRIRAIEYRNSLVGLVGTGTGTTEADANKAARTDLLNKRQNLRIKLAENIFNDARTRDSRGNRF